QRYVWAESLRRLQSQVGKLLCSVFGVAFLRLILAVFETGYRMTRAPIVVIEERKRIRGSHHLRVITCRHQLAAPFFNRPSNLRRVTSGIGIKRRSEFL